MATDMYLQLDHGEIKGETQREGHKDQIEVLSWSIGGSNASSAGSGTGGGAGRASLQDLSITKWVDSASPMLFQHMCQGAHYPKGYLYVYKSAGEKQMKYILLEFEMMYPTSVSTGGSGGEDRLTENVTFSFAKVVYKYNQQADDGTDMGEHVGSWDLRTVTK
jgi:type VI secretion system secreted protein Hcp